MKMLGKRISFKALTNEEDSYVALMDSSWFIYDHYLSIKE